jgi:two-component system, OmpR family, phosphate regulon sensor histidine kinase PhoR
MSKRNLYSIVTLMSFSLLGLIAFQWYWVSNYFEANKRELDWEINRVLARTSDRYLSESMEGLDYFSLLSDSISNTPKNTPSSYNMFYRSTHKVVDSSDRDNGSIIKNMGVDYMAKVNGLLNNLLTTVSQPKIINFDRLLTILDQELLAIGIDNEYNLAISNLNNKIIYYKDPETLKTTVLFGYKSPVILSSISTPYFTHLFIYHKGKLLLQKTWIILLSSLLLIFIVLACFAYALHIIYQQKKLSEVKTDFINNMTHELKTPISTVSLALEALVNFDVRNNKEKSLNYLDISRRELKRLSTMVEKVLNIAQYDKGGITLNKEHHHLNDLIENVVDTISMQIQKKKGVLVCELNANPDFIFADKVHFNNLLYNLIDNSNKYFINKPEILIATENYEKGIVLKLSDKGIGISKDELSRVFDKFYRVPTGNIHNVKGYGLGLSYVKDIVEMHDGVLKVTSEKNKGTTFIIYLPYERKN